MTLGAAIRFDAIDQAIAAMPAAESNSDIQMILRSAVAGPLVGVAFRWWRHGPVRPAEWRMDEGDASPFADQLPETDGDTWASLAPRVTRRDRADRLAVQTPVLGRLRSSGVLTAVVACEQAAWIAHQYDCLGRLILLAGAAQERVEANGIDRSSVRLAPREIECLSLAAEGLKAKQIAESLGIGQQTVQFHLARARIKLGAGNTVEAVVRAAQLALLRVRPRPAPPSE